MDVLPAFIRGALARDERRISRVMTGCPIDVDSMIRPVVSRRRCAEKNVHSKSIPQRNVEHSDI